jgi:transposase
MIHPQLRWRAVVLSYIDDVPVADIEAILKLKRRSIARWIKLFEDTGTVEDEKRPTQRRAVDPEIKSWIQDYVEAHPCFLLGELQTALKTSFPQFMANSIPTICRILRHDLSLTRKVLTRRAREARPLEIQTYFDKLAQFYSYPDQLLFLDSF